MRDKQLKKMSTKAKFLIVGTAAMLVAIPAIGQESPESLLPPGFGDPAPPPPPPASPPSSSQGSSPKGSSSQGSSSQGSSSQGSSSSGEGSSGQGSSGGSKKNSVSSSSSSSTSTAAKTDDSEDDEELEEVRIVFDVPPAGRRSLKQVGIISEARGGFAPAAFGVTDGAFLLNVLKTTNGPLASRWGTIMTRRLLTSRTDTPENVNGADWVAERAWLLLRMGDSVVARQLVQQVDPGNYTDRLYKVSMQTFLANGDLGGMCPLAEGGASKTDDPAWKMARPICSSLAGEQGAATGLLNQARSKRWMTGIDFLLTEKAMGAGTDGRRSVKIEWDKVTGFNGWRFGLASATGVDAPPALLKASGRHLNGWMAQLPMININSRMSAATGAASLGVLSNKAMVDIYARALDDADTNPANKELAQKLSVAYSGGSDSARVAAMAELWDKGAKDNSLQAMLVLTARSAALVSPSKDNAAQSDRLIASMMTAGLDSMAARWVSVVDSGSLGWGILVTGSPGMEGKISYSQLDDFYDNDTSENVHKSSMLLAGLAGLDRVTPEAQQDFIEKIEIDPTKSSSWGNALAAAADRGEAGTVVLLSAVGLQGGDWKEIPAQNLYHITRALRIVGLENEARMIAAEAVTFG
jgi:hypothetical protein